MNDDSIRLLLIESDRDKAERVGDLLRAAGLGNVRVRWEASYDAGIHAIGEVGTDLCLVAERLGERAGLDLLGEDVVHRSGVPVILLAERGGADLEEAAKRAGAAECVVRGELTRTAIRCALRFAAERRRRQLLDTRIRSLDLLDAVGQAVVATDLEGRILYWNRAAETLYGWIAEEAVGRDIADLMPPLASQRQIEEIMAAMRRGEQWTGEMFVRRRDGSTFLALIANAPIQDDGGRLRGIIGIASDITALRQTEAALRERVKELRTLYDASRVLNDTGSLPMSERLQRFVDLLPAGWLYPEITEARLVLESRVVTTAGFRETPWMQSALIGGGDDIVGRLDIAVTEERPPRDEGPFLREERELLEALAGAVGESVLRRQLAHLHAQTIASIEEAVIVIDSRGSGRAIAEVNPAAERTFGYSREEMLGRTTEMLHVDADVFERFAHEGNPALESRGVFRATYPLRRRDGTIFDAEQTVTLLQPERGVGGGAVSVIRDISERRRAETSLRESEERFRLIAEHISHVFWIRSVGSPRMDYVSPAYERVWGRHPDELYEDAGVWLKYIMPSDRARLAEALSTGFSEGSTHEYRILRPDGDVRWILDRSFPVRNDEGTVDRIIGVAEDITIRKQLEQRFGVLSQNITDVIYVLGTDGTVLLSSPSIREALGYSPAEFDGSSGFDFVHSDDRARVRKQFSAIVANPGATMRAQYRVITKDGATRHVESVARSLIDDPTVGGVLITSRDVTERLDFEDRLRQAQKLEATGRLAGGIAHDFNNILTVIRSQTDLLLMEQPEDRLAEEVRIIQDAADRAARLTSQLLAFSRDQVLRPEVVDLRAVVRGMDRIIERAVGERVSIRYDLPPGLPPIEVDPGQLEQAVMNLAVNARDAMPEGGELRIAAHTEEVRGSQPDAAPTTRTVLIVADDGTGMTDEVRSRIFEPFYTTKPRGKGTGLGLAVVYGVVTQSGGTIDVESSPGHGTTFRLRFPAATGNPAPVSTDAKQPSPETGRLSGHVLLVEDDPNVRRVALRILERAGLGVTGVEDAESGLAALAESGDYALVLTDLGLPGMSGREFAERVLATHPATPIIVMSGYDVESPGQQVELPRGVGFLPKPFTREGLVGAVRAVLGASRPENDR